MPTDKVNLAQKAGVKASSGKKRKTSRKKIIIGILVTIIVAMVVFLTVGGIYVYHVINPQNDVESVTPASHVTTASEYQDKVAYYVVGLLGSESTGQTEMLSIVCFDKQKNTVNILQIPKATYLGETGQWATKITGEVWANPKPLDWCTACGKHLSASEISNGKHTVCNTAVTQMPGSASEDLCDVFNEQYGLPVDGYFMLPQKALVKLTNLLGGIDVNLEAEMTVGDITYPAGVQTLDGDAALAYALNGSDGISGDIERLIHQRRVFLALFQRLIRQTQTQLEEDSIVPLMNSSAPISSNYTRTAMVQILLGMKGVKTSSMTAYVLPGEIATKSGVTYYSVHKAELLSLLNQQFHPYGSALTEADLGLTEISVTTTGDVCKQVMSEIEVAQSGAVVTTTAADTATTTAN